MNYLNPRLGVVVFFLMTCLAWSALALSAESTSVKRTQSGEARVALVIGNSAYPSGALSNPKNDATAVAGALKSLGFDVALKLNASKSDIDVALSSFSAKADKANVALVFYAGHGIQVAGVNYLVPVDAQPLSERDLKRQMVKLDDVIEDMGGAKVRLVFFDACRDNPVTRSFTRGGTRGMAAPVEATGTLISFATKHGNTALDGDGQHSPYTQSLLQELGRAEGVEVEQMLRRVQQGVRKATGGQQEPWRYGSLDGDFYFKLAQSADSGKGGQQELVERVVQDALRRANEDAAKDRARLQESMELMLKEALAKQRAALEAEKLARESGVRPVERSSEPPPKFLDVPARLSADVSERRSGQSEAVTKTETYGDSDKVAPKRSDAPKAVDSGRGGVWVYRLKTLFNGEKDVTFRQKASSLNLGSLEEITIAGERPEERVFDGSLALFGQTDYGLFVAPGQSQSEQKMEISWAPCRGPFLCDETAVKKLGAERIKVPAGEFDTTKFEVSFSQSLFPNRFWPQSIQLTYWYSETLKRVVRQSVYRAAGVGAAGRERMSSTMELISIQP